MSDESERDSARDEPYGVDGIDLNALGQAIDTTFTRSGASHGPAVSVRSVKTTLLGGRMLRVVYTTVVNMVRDREMRASIALCEKEADPFVAAAAKKIAADYADLAAEGKKKKIRLKRVSATSNVEMVDLNTFNQKRSAYYRRTAIFEIT